MNISMKKIALGLLSLFLVVGTINAQEGKKALKKGAKLLGKYGQNAVANADQLDEGLMLIEKAFEDEEVKSKAKNYNMLGEAYNQVVSAEINAKLVDPSFQITHGEYANKAFDALKMGFSKAEKDGDKKDAIKGMEALEGHLNNIAIYYFQTPDYANAFEYFNKAITVYKMINHNGGKSRLDDEVERKDHYFYTGAAGYYGKKGIAAATVLEDLIEMGSDKALPYEALYNIYAETDKPKAVQFLEKGREMFPDDTGLLFAEINYYLTEGKLDILTDKLKSALEKEPDNVTIYTTLGNVYDQLNQTERAAGNTEKADEYFDNALKYYTDALVKDPTNFDAVYSQGALYYNKAASLTGAINELVISYAGNLNNRFLFGVTLGIPFLKYTEILLVSKFI